MRCTLFLRSLKSVGRMELKNTGEWLNLVILDVPAWDRQNTRLRWFFAHSIPSTQRNLHEIRKSPLVVIAIEIPALLQERGQLESDGHTNIPIERENEEEELLAVVATTSMDSSA